ncbi:helix-turn-helix domain-containing protein [Paenibacillus hexagrammi]|uniref:AraC family transcriptional regulator n=1 Tax=Paenibacillus hexagrammi TaxID=2908839 RepID=A0ABY3SLA7_9BACL|nr:AraC family transcriptional regulator [Paenibacillus sp. YPD9-1]UJF34751.1 AraC family transcriptional regulator [Paenibacillus sp. YPD9-1]
MSGFEIERLRRDERFSMPIHHFHDFYEMYYLLNGNRYYFIQDRNYLIEEGNLVFIDKHNLHRTHDAGAPHHERILLHLDDPWFDQVQGDDMAALLRTPFASKQPVIALQTTNRSFVENILFSLLKEQQERRPGWELNSRSMLVQLLIFCSRLLSEAAPSTEQPHVPNDKILEIISYINQNFKNRLTLAHISETFYISSSYFCRIFKETSGFSFIEYLNNIRVREAQKLLRETKLKVIDIAELSGFDSIAHFGRVFKQVTKQTPLECRKLMRAPKS